MDDVLDVIEAFVDGEAIDPAELKRALTDDRGRDYLIDLLALRAVVGGPATARSLTAAAEPAFAGVRFAWARWLPAAAAIALIGGITGYVAGTRSAASPSPTATMLVVPSAPAPTRVIQLRNGVDWNEKAGGN
jgi:hypothetical protein